VSLVIKTPLIYLISDGSVTDENYQARSISFLKLVETAVQSKISLIQIREKKLSGRLLWELAKRAVQLCDRSETRILINDRLDIAIAAGADGVHLRASSIPANIVRSFAPKKFLIGVSAHSTDELEVAKTSGADFAVFGPVFETPLKGEPVGRDSLSHAVDATSPFPIIALGGIDSTNYREVLKTGCAGFAAIRFLNDPTSLKTISRELHL